MSLNPFMVINVLTECRLTPEVRAERYSLVPFTPEYNRVRWEGVDRELAQRRFQLEVEGHRREGLPAPEERQEKPHWIRQREKQIRDRRAGDFRVYHRNGYRAGIFSELRQNLLDDVRMCIARGLSIQTKTFRYEASTGNIFVEGHYVGTYDDQEGTLVKWTIKNNSSNLVLLRLRDFGVYLKRVHGKIYWFLRVGSAIKDIVKSGVKSWDDLVGRGTFKSVKYGERVIDQNDPAFRGLDGERTIPYIQCEVRENIVYPFNAKQLMPPNLRLNQFSFPTFLLPKPGEEAAELDTRGTARRTFEAKLKKMAANNEIERIALTVQHSLMAWEKNPSLFFPLDIAGDVFDEKPLRIGAFTDPIKVWFMFELHKEGPILKITIGDDLSWNLCLNDFLENPVYVKDRQIHFTARISKECLHENFETYFRSTQFLMPDLPGITGGHIEALLADSRYMSYDTRVRELIIGQKINWTLYLHDDNSISIPPVHD